MQNQAACYAIAVIGAGRRGRAFALRCLEAGFDVVLEDVLSSNLRRAEEEIMAQEPDRRSHLRLAGSVEDAVRDADIVIDFVPDELESKLEIFSMVDRMAPPRTILCTPTTLSISDLASCTYRATQCVALGNFGEHIQDKFELVYGTATSQDTMAKVRACLERLGGRVEVISEAMESAVLP